MTAGMAIEVGVLTTIAGGSLWKLNHLEDNARRFPNSAVAFALVIGYVVVGIWALALAAMAIKTGEAVASGWPAFWGAILVLAGIAAQKAGLLDPAITKAEYEAYSHATVGPVVCATIADPDDSDVLAGEIGDRIREREFKAMRPVGGDTDEYPVPVDCGAVSADADRQPLADVLPVRGFGHKAK